MNRLNEPTLVSLRQLVDTGKKSLQLHNIVIDYEGEVITDPEDKFACVSPNRFKFHTKISDTIKRNARDMSLLLETLLSGYHNSQVIELNGR